MIQLKNSGNTLVYEFPSSCNFESESWNKRLKSASRVHQHGSVITADERVGSRIISVRGIFGLSHINATYGATVSANLKEMKQQCYAQNLRLYPGAQYGDEYYNVECRSFEGYWRRATPIIEVDIDFLVVDPFRYYKDTTTDTSYLSQSLSLNGSGYASIADGSQAGLDMGESDFMFEGWIKTSTTGNTQRLFWKFSGGIYYTFTVETDNKLRMAISDGVNSATVIGSSTVTDGEWHYICAVLDRSGNGQIYLDGSTDGNALAISSVLTLNNSGAFVIGAQEGGTNPFTGSIDEAYVWNFGKDGLPADVTDYITWRYANPYAALSEYDSDAWAGYADADRSELVTNGDMEADANWTTRGTPTTEEQSADQARSPTKSWKIVSQATSEGAYQDITTVVGKWYEVTGYIYVTGGDAKLGKEDTDGSDQVLTGQATAAAWTEFNVIFLATETTSRIFFQSDATAVSTFYVDDMSVVRIGQTAHYKLNGDYTDETTNSNDLTAGGSGNSFVLASLPDDTVTNGGDVEVNPVITFTAGSGANISNLNIKNTTDSDRNFDYAPDSNLTENDVVEIDCKNTTVKLNTVNDISNFSGAFFELLAGNNSIVVTLVGTAGTNQCVFVFRKAWL